MKTRTTPYTGNLYLGYNTADRGTYRLSGAGSKLSSYNQYIGYSGNGNFIQSGGTNNAPGILVLGANVSGNGSYTLSGAGRP